jgi:hypothetical protein
VGRHVILPKTALDDVAALVQLHGQQLRALADCFASPESVSATSPEFIQRVSDRLKIGSEKAEMVVLVCQFLLTVVEDGNPVREVLDDVRGYIGKNDSSADKTLVSTFDARRSDLESLLAPKPERSRALKVRYLAEVFPTVDSFRTVCELRPVFEGSSGQETIVGYVSVVLLEVKVSDSHEEESTIHLHLSPTKIKDLEGIIKRTREKLDIIQRKFGGELLGGNVEE